jgi:hypothetical protein
VRARDPSTETTPSETTPNETNPIEATSRRAAIPCLAFLVVGCVGVTAMQVVDGAARGWLLVALNAAGVTAAAVASRRQRLVELRPGVLLLLGLALLVPAYTLWYPLTIQLGLAPTTPSLTDALFLAAYGCFIAALLRLIRLRGGEHRLVQLIDSLIISVGLGVLAWVLLISPYLHDGALSLPTKLVAISYPLIDVVLCGLMVRLLFQARKREPAEWLLTGWVVLQLALTSCTRSRPSAAPSTSATPWSRSTASPSWCSARRSSTRQHGRSAARPPSDGHRRACAAPRGRRRHVHPADRARRARDPRRGP